jgi:hypothetical protein
MAQIYTLDYIKQRAELTPKLTKIDIFEGFVNPSNKTAPVIKVQEIRPGEGRSFGKTWEFFSSTTYGDFTAVFFPSKEIIYFSNKPENVLNGDTMQNQFIPTDEMIRAQVEKALENERLKARVLELESEAEKNDIWGQRFGTALNMLIERWVMPGSSETIDTETAAAMLQGTDTETSPTEAALIILVEKFGEEWLQKFAAKIKAEPHLVNQIKNFFS